MKGRLKILSSLTELCNLTDDGGMLINARYASIVDRLRIISWDRAFVARSFSKVNALFDRLIAILRSSTKQIINA